ncbi:MAG: hypothetical protein US30_C0029G0007, partial [Candidatus Moranbacteria bacterium GW2011_GWF2_36_839]
IEIRKDFIMNLNILTLVYLTFAVIAVGVAVIIFLGNCPSK